MATKKDTQKADSGEVSVKSDVLREPAERLFANELEAIAAADKFEKPPGWRLSPKAVLLYIMGGKVSDTNISPKYVGAPRIVEIAIATLATDRALLLIGEPGTAKSWLSEHLAAAICNDSPAPRAGHGGHHRGADSLYLELRAAARGGAEPEGARALAHSSRARAGQARSLRGDHALSLGGAGRADHDPLREGPRRARASACTCRRSAGST